MFLKKNVFPVYASKVVKHVVHDAKIVNNDVITSNKNG